MVVNEDYRLRTMEQADLELVLQWRNSDRIREHMYTDQLITMDEHQAWFNKLKQNQDAVYQIFEIKQKPVGLINFTHLDTHNSKCNWGFYLGRQDLPRGSGAMMGYLGLEYAFEQLRMRKICGETFAFNAASIRFHQNLGFTQEGQLKKHVLKNGNYEDIILFALFNEDWQQKNQL